MDFLVRFRFALRPKRSIRRVQPDFVRGQFARITERKIRGDDCRFYAALVEEMRKNFFVGWRLFRFSLHFALELAKGNELVRVSLLARTIDFQIAQDQRAFAVSLEKNERIGRPELRRVQHIRVILARRYDQAILDFGFWILDLFRISDFGFRIFTPTVAALLQAGALLAVALWLVSTGRRAEQAERFRLASAVAPVAREVAYLRAAVALAPDRAELHVALADALVRRAAETGQRPMPANDADLREARRHCVLAQQQSPLSFDAHERALRLTALAVGKDLPEQGLDRLLRLSPSEPAPWFAAGRLALRRGERAEACRCWRNALMGGSQYLAEIAKTVPDTLSAAEFLEQVLPPNPALIVAALDAVRSGSLTTADERRYLRAALLLLAENAAEWTAEDHLLAARVHVRLDEVAAAQQEYQAALAQRPRSGDWRLEFCGFLHRAGLYTDARRELLLLMQQEPGNQAARGLYHQVLRDVAERQ